MGESTEVRELDHLALTIRELVEGAAHRARLVAAGGLDVGALGRLLLLLEPLGGRAAALVDQVPAQSIDPAVVDDAEHPRANAAALAAVAEPAAPDRQECLLHDVLGDAPVPDHAVGDRERGSAVPVVHGLERTRIARRDEVHQLLVGEPVYLDRSSHALLPLGACTRAGPVRISGAGGGACRSRPLAGCARRH